MNQLFLDSKRQKPRQLDAKWTMVTLCILNHYCNLPRDCWDKTASQKRWPDTHLGYYDTVHLYKHLPATASSRECWAFISPLDGEVRNLPLYLATSYYERGLIQGQHITLYMIIEDGQ